MWGIPEDMEWYERTIREKELTLKEAETRLEIARTEKDALEAKIADGHVDAIDQRRHELALRRVDVMTRHWTIRIVALCVTLLGGVVIFASC